MLPGSIGGLEMSRIAALHVASRSRIGDAVVMLLSFTICMDILL